MPDNSDNSCLNDGCNCFPGRGQSLVTLKETQKYIEDVREGDVVRMVNDDGSLGWSPVWCLAHQNPDKKSIFTELNLEERRVTLSPEHFVVVRDHDQMIDKMAKDVQVGDELYVVNGEVLGTESVVSVETVDGNGVFAPFTKSGRLLVNGVLCSCYAEVSPSVSHKALAGARAMYDITPKAIFDVLMTPNTNGVPHLYNIPYKTLKPLGLW